MGYPAWSVRLSHSRLGLPRGPGRVAIHTAPLEPLMHPCGAPFRLFKPLSRGSTILFLGSKMRSSVFSLPVGTPKGAGRVTILNLRPEAAGHSIPLNPYCTPIAPLQRLNPFIQATRATVQTLSFWARR
jgi:hypothetical protein